MNPRLILVAIPFLALVACGPPPASGKGSGKKLVFPVEVMPVQIENVTFSISAPGSVEAFETVSVTARVPGVAEKVTFAVGDQVDSDQVLVDIDPERYRLAVDQAKAVLAKAEATWADAQSALKRREEANRATPGLVRDEDIQTARTRVLAADADVAGARTALAKADLDLRDALIRSPLAGIIQTRGVQTGQYVQTGMTLATLLRRDPMHVVFQISEIDASRLTMGNPVEFTVNGNARVFTARINHIAAAADAGSRMVLVRARIDDAVARDLRPGAFAQCRVPVGGISAPVIVQMAVRPSERGFLAFVVDHADASKPVARERVLKLGMRDLTGRVEVRSGLSAGESLVVRGAEALRDGVQVDVRPAEKTKNPDSNNSGERPAESEPDPVSKPKELKAH
jgi:multidrug efflux system membrane fusion protein